MRVLRYKVVQYIWPFLAFLFSSSSSAIALGGMERVAIFCSHITITQNWYVGMCWYLRDLEDRWYCLIVQQVILIVHLIFRMREREGGGKLIGLTLEGSHMVSIGFESYLD